MTPDRLERFARHIVLPEVGGAGQARLVGSHVVLVGMGGIGSPALQYLAGAGIGRLTLIDDDVVEASNLQRQTIFGTGDIGRPKAEAAAAWLKAFDPALHAAAHVTRLMRDNAATLIAGADVVLDGSDNFATRLAVSDACVAAGVPLTSAALGRFQGQVANFAGHRAEHACSIPRIATAAPIRACWARWSAWSVHSARWRPCACCWKALRRWAIRSGDRSMCWTD